MSSHPERRSDRNSKRVQCWTVHVNGDELSERGNEKGAQISHPKVIPAARPLTELMMPKLAGLWGRRCRSPPSIIDPATLGDPHSNAPDPSAPWKPSHSPRPSFLHGLPI